jgi:thioredoxin-like negative regulator of GroEL
VKGSSAVTVADEETEVMEGIAEDRQPDVQLPEAAPVIVGFAAKRSLADSAAVQPQTVTAKQGTGRMADQKERAATISGIMVAEQPMAPNLMDTAMKEYEAGSWEQAADHFEQVLATDPENMKAAYHLASCYFKEKRFKKAERVLEPVLLDTAGAFHKKAIELSEQIKKETSR